MQWVPALGANRPCVVYCAGHGWSARHPAAFYDPSVGEDLFLNSIEGAEATQPVVCISMFQASSRYNMYDNTTPTAWADGSFTGGDIVKHNSVTYRCRKTHSSPSPEPGVTGGWELRWFLCPKSDLGVQRFDGYADTPAYRGSNADDLRALLQYLVRNAAALKIDPAKICVMGSSAGGQQAGAVAFGNPAPFMSEIGTASASPESSLVAATPACTILKITPDDFNNYPTLVSLTDHLMPRVANQSDWDDVPDSQKSAMSPLGTLQATDNAIPTFLAYGENSNYSRWANSGDDPPYSTGFHDAANGHTMFVELVDVQGQAGCTFTQASTTGGQMEVWEDSTAAFVREVADTTEGEEMWAWLQTTLSF